MTDDNDLSLLPCPFCGGDAKFCEGPSKGWWGTMCKDCDVWRDDRHGTQREAAEAWNTRAIPAVAASQPAEPAVNAGSRQWVTVKPLVWDGGEILVATGTDVHITSHIIPADMRDEYEVERAARILAAIDTQPDPRDAVIARLVEALTASGDTKAAYMGEFHFPLTTTDEDGEEVTSRTYVPWTTVKEIMAAILDRAAIAAAKGGAA